MKTFCSVPPRQLRASLRYQYR